MTLALRQIMPFCLAGIIALTLTACGSRSGSLSVRGLAPLHVNEAGESTPVQVRVFQLKKADRFQAASVEALWRDHRSVLGDDLAVEPGSITVSPGVDSAAPVVHQLGTLAEGVQAIGVLAQFRKPDAQDRRTAVIPVAELGKKVLEFRNFSVQVVAAP